MKNSRHNFEFIWHTISLILLSGAFVPLWRQLTVIEARSADGDPVQRVILLMAYFGVGLLIFQSGKAVIVASKGYLLWLLIGWTLLSSLWSIVPLITLRSGFSALLASLYGLLLAIRYPPRTVLKILGVALGTIVVASSITIIIFPQWGVMGLPHPGAWQGVMFHKNALGRLMIPALVIFWVLYQQEKNQQRKIWAILALAASILLFGSRSSTAIVIILALPISWLALRLYKRIPLLLKPAVAMIIISIVVLTVLMLPDYLETVVSFFGKDITLTGRVPLWEILIPIAMQNMLFGYGYGGFWLGQNGPSATVWALTWNAPHAHNGYLDLWLQLGLIGVTIAILIVLSTFFRMYRNLVLIKNEPLYIFGTLFCVYIIIADTSGTTLLESSLGKAFYWIVFVYIYFVSLGKLPKKKLATGQFHQ